jgi:plastocyanin
VFGSSETRRHEVAVAAERRWTARLVIAAMALTMLGAACSSDNPTTSTDTPAAPATTAAAGGGSGGTSGGSAQTVSQANYTFSPSTFSVKSGDTITVKNTTPDTPHTFTITGQSVDVTLDPNTSQKVKIALPAGTYPFICRFHESQGMTGTLTVN